ncbi:uncharacterized protein LOC126381028 isoform X1 [Pectinophora gossypiella]|uniref:uncharacterized protein LOC126381028 isoform X1 n=1 Tax=Pectinophora gossypiella TaxID=13191 RepID=UPI00214E2215|nr:uncharacterized protein LOC126381028 isoform X1 [Pectinophora gossypiella]XP_049886543.1 uncharacterized protein LOC126381028 isoform X1 [Pectinophora gossypiella]
MPKITTSIPNTYINTHDIPIPSGICLADPSYNVPSSIDILVGADVFWSVIGTNRIQLGNHNPVLFETKLGWLISGVIHQPSRTHTKPVCMFVQDTQASTDMTRFWELDTILPKHDYTKEERACELSFIETTKRKSDGRFVVTIPLCEPPEALGSSYEMAKRRFLSLERRFEREPTFKKRYVEFMEEYEALGHMSENTEQKTSTKSYYLPHHGVVRESSLTTKLRVVFDASAATTSGKSLNSIQLVGPTVQDDLLSILLRFRQHKIVVSADIEKMYRQIEVDSSQRALQQILWRADPSHQLKKYILNTVTYGTASAPFLSTRCLLQLSKEAPDTKTQQAIARDFYVDDFLSGADSIPETIALCRSVTDTLMTAQFNLRKWQSSNTEVLESVSNNDCPSKVVDLSANELSKTLGLNWQCNTDTLTFSINSSLHTNITITKRHILSTIAQVFDPLGLVSPCIVEAKILMQKLWIDKCSWDDEVSVDIKKLWHNFAHTLPHLNDTNIPRWVMCNSPSSIQLHIFTDASEKAYGACVYVRTVASDGSVTVRLLTSKSKVAPIKPTTIPRLELCGALVGARLCTKVLNSLTIKPECIFWCDSTIVLGWLASSPVPLKPFVRHRVCEIQEGFPEQSWRYVPTKENPADLVSRGLSANLISDSTLWWSGPSFLLSDPTLWPETPNKVKTTDLPDTITVKCLHVTESHDVNPISKLILESSNFAHLHRVMAYVLRFVNNCRRTLTKQLGCLKTSELNAASYSLLRIAQQESFSMEYELLKLGKNLPKKNRLISLSTFIENGIIRVGGRLENSFYDYNVKHPILICSKHHLAELIFTMFHLRLYHGGPQLLLATVRHTYWALGGRNLAKKTVRTCVKCIRFKAQTVQPIMGNLPKQRVQLEFPFIDTGTDYAGPILLADRKGRGCKLIKSYICIFICLATKAMHLELVSDLSKEAFIAALNRFTARRGKPRNIYSDNGTTFVGCFNELSNILKQDLSHDMAGSGINFSFIPAYTPHFGGLWESAVKSVKHHLRRILGLTHLTYEEMSTCLIQVEAILNSRPLTPLSNDPSDLTPLTPAHLLVGRSLMCVPHPQISNAKITSLQRFQRVEYLKQHFWRRFSNEYVSSLQQRTKWRHSTGQLEQGALVIVKEKNLPPLMWLLGRVVHVVPGRDGIARVADIKTKKGIIRRAYNMLCPLPIK